MNECVPCGYLEFVNQFNAIEYTLFLCTIYIFGKGLWVTFSK